MKLCAACCSFIICRHTWETFLITFSFIDLFIMHIEYLVNIINYYNVMIFVMVIIAVGLIHAAE